MYDATGVRLVAGRQVDDCYFSGVIYSMMAVVVGGMLNLKIRLSFQFLHLNPPQVQEFCFLILGAEKTIWLVSGVGDFNICFAFWFKTNVQSLKAKIKAAHSYAFPDSSTLVALDERPNLEVHGKTLFNVFFLFF
ncbi:hypothetical protein Hanom_Chr14g01291001 [Helianthus anomalus]